ncbi:hypothetical protein SAMN02745124_02660 [Desulfofustis glycolicus DSM 9705]|uniref:Uncharacterized protein n=1 Tax=Desulfofustis glycolicus DSM 9705 TaxID=1121409 RepID=A0A1M5X0I6_9BACT|nr:hypothetical protein SAMN02745124_02660 [Desulfofustis glycolicus DSM 9705]
MPSTIGMSCRSRCAIYVFILSSAPVESAGAEAKPLPNTCLETGDDLQIVGHNRHHFGFLPETRKEFQPAPISQFFIFPSVSSAVSLLKDKSTSPNSCNAVTIPGPSRQGSAAFTWQYPGLRHSGKRPVMTISTRADLHRANVPISRNCPSIQTSTPPGARIRTISARARRGCGNVQSTQRLTTAATCPLGASSASASPTDNRTRFIHPAVARLRLARASMAGDRSIPFTRYPLLTRISVRNPVPEPTSKISAPAATSVNSRESRSRQRSRLESQRYRS